MDVRTFCLGILTAGEATGYEMKKAIEEGVFRQCVEASYGSIYPALARLTDGGFVNYRIETQNGKPDRKIYQITPSGRELFIEELLKEPDMDRVKSDFLFITLFSENLPAEHMQRLIDQRLNLLKELERFNAEDFKPTSVGATFAVGYWRTILRASIEYLEENRHVFDRAACGGKHEATAGLTRTASTNGSVGKQA